MQLCNCLRGADKDNSDEEIHFTMIHFTWQMRIKLYEHTERKKKIASYNLTVLSVSRSIYFNQEMLLIIFCSSLSGTSVRLFNQMSLLKAGGNIDSTGNMFDVFNGILAGM